MPTGNKLLRLVIFLLLTTFLCAETPSPHTESAANETKREPLGLPLIVRQHSSPEEYKLGKSLYYSSSLSTRGISCNDCHPVNGAGASSRHFIEKKFKLELRRAIPQIANHAYGASYMWDGRAKTLEDQVYFPLENECEMRINWAESLEEISRLLGSSQQVNKQIVAASLAAYVESLLTAGSRFDRFFYAKEDVLSDSERRGLDLFRGRANCSSCHVISSEFALFTDGMYHNLGIGFLDKRFRDDGRIGVTKLEKDLGAFRTPTLRNIARTAPYMHDDGLSSLEDVIEFYNRGGNDTPSKDRRLAPLGLSKREVNDIVDFLTTLDSEIVSLPPKSNGEQGGADQPATHSELDSEGGVQPQLQSEGHR